MNRSLVVAVMAVVVGIAGVCVRGEELANLPSPSPTIASQLAWGTDYHAAIQIAKDNKQLVMLWFYDAKRVDENAKFASTVLADDKIQPLLANMSLVKLSTTATIEEDGEETTLLKHSSFRELQGGPGLAMIDMRDAKQNYYGWVVSVYPFRRGAITVPKLMVLCDLPAGTLSQRTLIFAVRTHPAAPQSA